MMSKMIDLQKCIRIPIGIGDHEDNPQETTVAKNFANDRMHFHFFHTFLSRCFDFTILETIRSTSRSIDEQRMVLEAETDYPSTRKAKRERANLNEMCRIIVIDQFHVIVIIDVSSHFMIVVSAATTPSEQQRPYSSTMSEIKSDFEGLSDQDG
jgi:hypothetical protein